jgi:hypothetical protein
MLALFLAGIVVLWWQRERLRKKYYELRFPEKLITINIIYPGGLFRKFYRLIPEDSIFAIEGGMYSYNDEAILRNNDWYSYKDKAGDMVVRVEENEYNLNTRLGIKQRWDKWPELYYKEGLKAGRVII